MSTTRLGLPKADRSLRGSVPPRVVFYYPFFPNYRRAVLSILATSSEISPEFIAGVRPRAGLTPLRNSDFNPLLELPTLAKFGCSWNPGAIRHCLSRRADIVVVAPATRSISTLLVLVGRRASRRPTILWGQCGKPGDRSLKRIAQELLNRLSSDLFVYGNAEMVAATERGTSTSKVAVVNNAILSRAEIECQLSDPFCDPMDRRRRAGGGDLCIAYMGRMLAMKRLEILVDAAEILQRQYGRVRLLMIGDGAARPDLERLCEAKRVLANFVGSVHDPEQISSLLKSATVICSPHELGLLAVDAIIHGVPVLIPDNDAHNGPEVDALTEGVNSIRVQPDSADAIARGVGELLTALSQISAMDMRRARDRGLADWTAESVAARILEELQRIASRTVADRST